METRGRYVLIGAFTVFGFLGIVGFLMWFGAAQSNRQFAYYDVLFDTVSGITRSSEVRFAGLPVGQVQELDLDPLGSGMVRVRLEIAALTPVRTGSVATLEGQGVTGTSIVAITPGDPSQPLLRDTVEGVPIIPSGLSPLQSLTVSGPALLEQALQAAERINTVLSAENIEHVESIIANVDEASARLANTLANADEAMAGIGGAVEAISGLSDAANVIAERAGPLIDTAGAAIRDFAGLRDQAASALDAGTRALTAAEEAIATDLRPALADLAQTSGQLRETVATLAPEAEGLVSSWNATGQAAAARLAEAEPLIASLTATAQAIDAETIGRLNATLDTLSTELPQIAAQLRETADALGPGVQDLVATWGETGTQATARLAEAQTLIASLDAAATRVTALTDTWTAAGSAATARLNEAEPLIASLRASASAIEAETLERLNATLDTLSTELPQIATQLRQTVDRLAPGAEQLLATWDETGTAAAARLAEAETLIATLDTAAAAVTAVSQTWNSTGTEATARLDEAEALIASLRASADALDAETIGRVNAALDQMATDLPALTGDLRQAGASAAEAFTAISDMVGRIRGPLDSFLSAGLPEYTRLGGDLRGLTSNLSSLVAGLRSGPAGGLISNDRNVPEFRR
ncbi:MCE family protein [Paracoccus sp. S-4012]|uniref:MlaD family protein n=1 Tax=Paracoccus sp. S-4012 TaxID=2665648 RepID=UPI0012AF5AF2|nr:MlaD family protein [Paracoccus sp. S-4012]MRX50530.1 MCE family protein [Paracoccus sp. S-4012]